jgi:hypothetical protein
LDLFEACSSDLELVLESIVVTELVSEDSASKRSERADAPFLLVPLVLLDFLDFFCRLKAMAVFSLLRISDSFNSWRSLCLCLYRLTASADLYLILDLFSIVLGTLKVGTLVIAVFLDWFRLPSVAVLDRGLGMFASSSGAFAFAFSLAAPAVLADAFVPAPFGGADCAR